MRHDISAEHLLIIIKNTKSFVYRHNLLSHLPKQIVSSVLDAFTTLFGMGRSGSHPDKTPVNKKFGADDINISMTS